MTDKLQFSIYRPSDAFGLEMRIYYKTLDGRLVVAEPLTMKEVEKGQRISGTMNIEEDDARRLMDALWDAGIRPSNGEGAVGQLGAMKDHIETLRQHCTWFKEMAQEKPAVITVPEVKHES